MAELLTRPVGRPSHKPVVWYKSFLYLGDEFAEAQTFVQLAHQNEATIGGDPRARKSTLSEALKESCKG